MATNSLGLPATSQDWNNWQGDKTPMQGQSIDANAILRLLLQPNAADPSTVANNLGPATLKQLGNIGATTEQAIGPYQQGVAKALKALGEQHATEAAAAGVSPTDIQNHEIMNNQQDQSTKVLSSLLSMVPKNNGFQENPTPEQVPITQQRNQNNYGYKPDNPVSAFFNMLGITPSADTQLMLTQAQMNRQKIEGKEPIQPYQQLQQDVELKKAGMTNLASKMTMILGQENEISKEYSKELEPLKNAASSFTNLQGLYKSSLAEPSGTNDLGMIYELIKMYDPNAVKEGEIANVQQASKTVPQWAVNAYNKVFTGQMLSQDLRDKIMNTASTKYNATQKRFSGITDQYAKKVSAYGGSPERALINYNVKQDKSTSSTNKSKQSIGRFQVEVH